MIHQSIINSNIRVSDLAVNKVLRNTYFLLSLSLLVSSCAALFAMANNAQPIGMIIMLAGFIGLPILIQSLSNSHWGLAAMFVFAAFSGYSLGPILNMFMTGYVNGTEIIFASLGSTGLIFLSLSAYVLSSRKDFSFMGGMLFIGVMVAFLAGLASVIFNLPMLNIIVSAAFALLSSAMILYHTSLIIHGGERNYIVATLGIYVALFNLFISLLRIFAFLAGNRD